MHAPESDVSTFCLFGVSSITDETFDAVSEMTPTGGVDDFAFNTPEVWSISASTGEGESCLLDCGG